MRKLLFCILLALPFLSFSQQQLTVKGFYPNFYILHNVNAGETYNSISKMYNVPPVKLANYNDLTLHDGKIFARTLRVPLTTQNFSQKNVSVKNEILVPVDYLLNEGEAVNNVVARFKLSVAALKELNNLSEAQLYNRKQLIVGFLRVKPDVASLFELRKTNSEVSNKSTNETVQQPVAKTNERQAPTGVREAKRRGEEQLNVKEEIVSAKTDTVQEVTHNVRDPQTSKSNLNSKRIKVFVDCSNTWCDNTFIRTEINIVDFMLDRVASDVHMLITSQQNGNGGSQFQMIFYGQNKFKSLKDTLRFNLDPNATDVERRDAMLKYIKFGLTPFIAKSDYANEVNIQMKKSEQANDSNTSQNTKDKWNYWVFRAGASGSISQDEVYIQTSLYSNVSANRTTDKSKVYFGASINKNISKISYTDSSGKITEVTNNSSYEAEHSYVKSIGERWAVGYETEFSNYIFSNNKSRVYFKAAIEYAIFPYKEVNNKFFTINYGIDVRRNKYYDTTLYDKMEETLLGHSISSNLSFNQKWGSFNTSLSYRNYLKDFNLNNLGLSLNLNVRISGGLSVSGYFYGELVGDQIYLPKKAFDPVDLFTRRRQVASNYNFYSSAGLSYRFGSKLNNFVNPRLNF